MRWISVVLVFFLLLMQFAKIMSSKFGYPVKQNIWSTITIDKTKTDSIFYVAKGIVAIKSNVLINSIFVAETNDKNPNFNFGNVDLIGLIGFLICMHFFTKAILKYGPFKKETILWLKNGVVLTTLIFFLKTLCIFLLMYSFGRDYPNSNYTGDSQNLFGYGWLYFGIFLSFIMNIFNYGRKLQEENDLTV